MHIEIQVALNFVISYLYNKLPRRRVNIFGEELERALRDKFQGHWYPEKPFKGSAFRCLKTGDPTDAVLERAARESGVPIADILENLPNELSVWVDPGEVSYRIGEKGSVKILYSENSDNHEDNNSADREVTKTFNPEAQCFRPIDSINTSMNNLSLSPKTSPHCGSSPHSTASTSPNTAGSQNMFLQRNQAPLTFTTATFAQTKFGSTKLKSNSKRTNSNSYRMSPTEFSNYIKQRAMQQHSVNGPVSAGTPQPNHFGPIGPVSPARSLSPNPMPMNFGQGNDPFFFPNISLGIYPQFNGQRNIFDNNFQNDTTTNCWPTSSGQNKFNGYLDPQNGFFTNSLITNQGLQSPGGSSIVGPASPNLQQQPQQLQSNDNNNLNMQNGISSNSPKEQNEKTIHAPNNTTSITVTLSSGSTDNSAENSPISTPTLTADNIQQQQKQEDSNNSKLIDGINSFYSNATGSSYQQLLVAN